MTKATANVALYRPCAGAVVFNAQGRVWLGRRASETHDDIWQYPQGGIDAGEDAAAAVLREVQEETGISPAHLAPLRRIKSQLFYDLPEEYRMTPRTQKWRGQRQYWFAFRFLGTDSDINILAQNPPEFSTWKWGDIHHAVDTVVPFKRDIYARLAREFAPLAQSSDKPTITS